VDLVHTWLSLFVHYQAELDWTWLSLLAELVLIMFIYAIFGMSFFMHVRHNAGLDELFNYETCLRSMMVLFQVMMMMMMMNE